MTNQQGADGVEVITKLREFHAKKPNKDGCFEFLGDIELRLDRQEASDILLIVDCLAPAYPSVTIPLEVLQSVAGALEEYFDAIKKSDGSDPGDYMLQEALRQKFSYARDGMKEALAALKPYLVK